MPTIAPDARATIYTSMGEITLELLSKKAPRTVENFVKLAHDGFYDGHTFHRILKDFVIQGGCPKGDGTGGPGYTIRPEFNDTPHVPGTVSMARDNDPHSAGSQFFICAGEAPYLDSRFSAFGKVVEGLDVVDKISNVKTHDGNKYKEKSTPLDPIYINRVELEGVEFEPEAPAEKPASRDDADGDGGRGEQGGGGGEQGGGGGGRGRRRRGGGGGGGKRAESQDDGGGESAPQTSAPEKAADESGGDDKPKRPRKKAARKKAPAKSDAKSDGDAPAAEDKPKRPRKKAVRKKAKSDDADS